MNDRAPYRPDHEPWRLTQEEIKELREEMKRDIEWGLEQLRLRKARKKDKQS